jgi:NAD(P)H-hydrate epimerase
MSTLSASPVSPPTADGVSRAPFGLEILTSDEMARADRAAARRGVPTRLLMERAGAAVAEAFCARWPAARRVAALAGPGANGGDGYVVARLLAQRGIAVHVFALGRAAMQGDAGEAATAWEGETSPLVDLSGPEGAARLARCDVVIDALFGAGLSRPLDAEALRAVDAVAAWRESGRERGLLAVDVPSGLHADTGFALGAAAKADLTVTFARKKPGHCLSPGRRLCGRVHVADIGVSDEDVASVGASAFRVAPELWRGAWTGPGADSHKFTRGHAVVTCGGPWATGAARLCARGALRIGAGVATLAAGREAAPIAAAHLTAIMLSLCEGPDDLTAILADPRVTACALGPGGGVGERTRSLVLAALEARAALVLDADALTSFAQGPGELFARIAGREAPVALTPHEGEFKRLFGDLGGSKLERARKAATRSGATVILKGADTVIAGPDGRAAILDFDAPYLATAGSGDVLAGFVTGLLAQGVPVFSACAAAVWTHASLGARLGPGMIAEDLPDAAPVLLAELFGQKHP